MKAWLREFLPSSLFSFSLNLKAPEAGLEPATGGLTAPYSTD